MKTLATIQLKRGPHREWVALVYPFGALEWKYAHAHPNADQAQYACRQWCKVNGFEVQPEALLPESAKRHAVNGKK